MEPHLRHPPFSLSPSCLTSSDVAASPPARDESALSRLSNNLHALLSPIPDSIFNDAIVYVQGRAVPVHRCILAARCPFFRALFSEDKTQLQSLAPDGTGRESTKLRIDLQRLLTRKINVGRVGYEAFMVVLGFLYSGKLTIPVVKCVDDQCMHEACLPVVDFALEMLRLSFVLDIPDLKNFWQHRLLTMVEKAQVDDVLPILVTAGIHGAMPLHSYCMQITTASNLDIIDIEKQLPLHVTEEILAMRIKLGLLRAPTLNPMHEKQCRRILKALDSDDIELVELLLKEGQISLDEVYALHHAAAYCDPHTMQEILELGAANPNLKDKRGYTVLHIAAMRRNPTILVALLISGAHPLEVTTDGRTALQLSKRLTRKIDNTLEAGEESQKDRLCIEILEQAGKENPFTDTPLFPAVGEKDLFLRLLYLENRVALARLLFPREAKIVMGIAHLEATSEFTGLGSAQVTSKRKKEAGVDLNQFPPNYYAADSSSVSTVSMDDNLLRRVQALQKTVELGKRFFPQCSAILNKFMDDDVLELTCMEKGGPDEQKAKRQRYVELKNVLAEAFQRDVAAMDGQKSNKSDMLTSSSSSYTSSFM